MIAAIRSSRRFPSSKSLKRLAVISAAAMSLAHVAPLSAQLYWDRNNSSPDAGGATPSGSWDNSSINWNLFSDGTGPAGPWAPDSAAVFSAGSDATGAFTITLVGTQSASSITVEEGAPTFAGDELDISGSNITLNDNLTATFNNVVGGGSGITKQGNGTIVLSNAGNTFSGDVNLNGGVTVIGADGALGNSGNVVNFSGGTLLITGNLNTARSVNLNGDGTFDSGASDATFSGIVGGGATLNKLGAGSLTLSNNANGFTGQINVRSGALVVTATNSLGTPDGSTNVSDGAALLINNTINLAEPIHIVGSGISNAGAIRKLGTNATLSGGITLDGPARINSDANTLTISTNAITSGNNDNLTIGGAGNTTASAGMIQIGNGTLIKDGAGTLNLSGTNAMGGIRISGGVVTMPSIGGSNASTLGGVPAGTVGQPDYASAYIVLDGGTLLSTVTSNGSTFTQPQRGITLTSNGGRIYSTDSPDHVTSQNVSYAGIVSLDPSTTTATLYKVGDGELRAAPPSTTTGWQNTRLEIDEGFYRASTGIGSPAIGDQAFGQVPAQYDASAIFLNGSGTSRGHGGVAIGTSAGITTPPTRGITIGPNGATFITNATWTIQSIITGQGGLILNENGWMITSATASSTLILSGSNSYQGSTLINNGTLDARGGFAIPDNSAVTVASTSSQPSPTTGKNDRAILRITDGEVIGSLAGGGGTSVNNVNYGSVSLNGTLTTGGNGQSTTFAGPIAGGGGLTKAGAGTFTLTGTNTYTGQTTVTAGALKVNPASQTPLLTNTTGTDIQGGRAVFDYAGGASPGGTIKPMLQAGFTSHFNDTANAIHSSTGTANKGLGYRDDTANSLFTVAYTYYGDANLTGTVDASDFTAMSQHFGNTNLATAGSPLWSEGDFNYDGKINALDFNALATNFGAPALGAPPALGTLVPEPGAAALLALAAPALRRRRIR